MTWNSQHVTARSVLLSAARERAGVERERERERACVCVCFRCHRQRCAHPTPNRKTKRIMHSTPKRKRSQQLAPGTHNMAPKPIACRTWQP
eukprot:820048-Rhodomonas_salina.1